MPTAIKIFDTTLRDGEQSPGCSMNLAEKIEVAKQLERLKVDVIEAGFAISSPGDFESVKTIAETVKNATVASLARAVPKDIDVAWDAVKGAVKPRIHVFVATSPIHMEYKLKKTPEEVLNLAGEMVRYAKSKCDDIEFSAEDACRSDLDFLVKVFERVIENGATVINVPDTVGYIMPEEMYERITYLKKHVKGIDKVDISVHCHDDLGLAVANSLAAIRAGATQVECTINGIGERAGNAAMEEIVMALHTRKNYYGVETNIETTQIYRTSKLLSKIIGVMIPPNKAIVGANAFAHESGIHQHGVLSNKSTYEIMTHESIGIPDNKMVLGKHSGRHAFDDRLKSLGFNLTKEQLDEAFQKFKVLADKKKTVSDADIEALVSSDIITHEEYKLSSFVVNSGTVIDATATIALEKNGEIIKATSMGKGQVEAAFTAISNIVGINPELADYQIHSVTQGEDALGEVIVKLKLGDKIRTGRGLSTDIIEASISAYLNGINKLLNV